VAAEALAELELSTVSGERRTLNQWLTTFQLALVVVDPYTNESAWILDTAARLLDEFREADCRVGWLVTSDARDAKRFLGPLAERYFTLVDPDRAAISALGIERLPALVHVRQDAVVVNKAEGWHPSEWQAVTDTLGKMMSWSQPKFPTQSDPGPFDGTPAKE
jgi:hypothetical protein